MNSGTFCPILCVTTMLHQKTHVWISWPMYSTILSLLPPKASALQGGGNDKRAKCTPPTACCALLWALFPSWVHTIQTVHNHCQHHHTTRHRRGWQAGPLTSCVRRIDCCNCFGDDFPQSFCIASRWK